MLRLELKPGFCFVQALELVSNSSKGRVLDPYVHDLYRQYWAAKKATLLAEHNCPRGGGGVVKKSVSHVRGQLKLKPVKTLTSLDNSLGQIITILVQSIWSLPGEETQKQLQQNWKNNRSAVLETLRWKTL